MMLHAILVETHANADLLEKVIRKMTGENHYFFQWEGICVTGPSLALGRRMESFRKERRI